MEIGQRAQTMQQQYVAQGWQPAQAQQAARHWQEGQEGQLQLALQGRQQLDQTNARVTAAGDLSQRYGMPVGELLKYPDVAGMQLAAQQHQSFQGQFTAQQQQIDALKQQMSQFNAPPQSFQGANGAGTPTQQQLWAAMAEGNPGVEQAFGSQMDTWLRGNGINI